MPEGWSSGPTPRQLSKVIESRFRHQQWGRSWVTALSSELKEEVRVPVVLTPAPPQTQLTPLENAELWIPFMPMENLWGGSAPGCRARSCS